MKKEKFDVSVGLNATYDNGHDYLNIINYADDVFARSFETLEDAKDYIKRIKDEVIDYYYNEISHYAKAHRKTFRNDRVNGSIVIVIYEIDGETGKEIKQHDGFYMEYEQDE
jgi:hypothetical protein